MAAEPDWTVPDCVFCDIIEGHRAVQTVTEWDNAVSFVPLHPVTFGHVLVVPRRHVRDALEAPGVAAEAMERAAELAHRPCNLITSCGVEATQTVFHLHVHVVPRREGDGLALPWTDQMLDEGGD